MKHKTRPNPYKAKYEAELARANKAEACFRLLAKAVSDATDTARKFDMDVLRDGHRLPSFVALASKAVHDDIVKAYMLSIKGVH